jgi:LacI family transcriptional regulator
MVSEETRRKIIEAVEAAGYHRNALVRALRSNRTHVVGIVVPGAGFSFFSEIIRAAENEASGHGLQCFLCQSHNQPGDLVKEIAALREYRVDGILVAPSSSAETTEVYKSLLAQKFPFVLIDVPVDGVNAPFVGNDNVRAGYLATEHLVELGHERIAFINGYHGNPASSERLNGYRKSLAKAGLPFREELVVGDGFEFATGRDAVRSLIDSNILFSALIAPSDIAAMGAMQELGRFGVSVPGQVSIVGCGNLDVSSMTTPSLTTVDQKPLELGRVAMEVLVSQIEGKSRSAKKVIVKPEFIVRESTKRRSRT